MVDTENNKAFVQVINRTQKPVRLKRTRELFLFTITTSPERLTRQKKDYNEMSGRKKNIKSTTRKVKLVSTQDIFNYLMTSLFHPIHLLSRNKYFQAKVFDRFGRDVEPVCLSPPLSVIKRKINIQMESTKYPKYPELSNEFSITHFTDILFI